ncbi:MAG: hypothetical protein WAV30_03690 [Microgenomates group bacterium]
MSEGLAVVLALIVIVPIVMVARIVMKRGLRFLWDAYHRIPLWIRIFLLITIPLFGFLIAKELISTNDTVIDPTDYGFYPGP